MDYSASLVIASWEPKVLDSSAMRENFLRKIRKILSRDFLSQFDLQIEVWSPERTKSRRELDFHKDGIGDSIPYVLVWANNNPTVVKLQGTLLPTKPGDIILINNLVDLHSAPLKCPKKRWFIRGTMWKI